MKKLKRVNTHIYEHQISQLDSLAPIMGIKRAEMIREAIDEYIDSCDIVDPNNNEFPEPVKPS